MVQSSYENLPSYLRRYCAAQDYDKYTARDHAAWRYIMRQSREYFRDNAVPIYLSGLKKTGIPLDRIPRISEMDRAMQEFGWGAVPVCGFIPPIAFLDLQARGILPIATDMRSIDHIAYTPSPDIVHEAAGHAPIIADEKYRAYLRQYASVADKTIMSREDLNLYEAIRVLSDIKENPDTKPEQIVAAQAALDKATAAVTYVSEATMVSRMAWWTVEYGLVGSLKKPKIYGAGLLSSVGESQNCLSDRVRKIPLTVKCVETTYDITEPQPQLFVAEDMDQLTHVLHDLEHKLAFKLGGVHGLETARKSQTVNTIELDNGVQVSGILSRYEATVDDGKGVPHFMAFSGPVQLSSKGHELAGQGRARHAQGFSMPFGRWRKFPDKSPARLSPAELESCGVRAGQKTTVELTNGFAISGTVVKIVRDQNFIQYLTWSDCTVTRGSQSYFEPSWGEFDMPVADQVVSAFGGPADRESYGEYDMGGVSTQPGRTSPFTAQEQKIFACYAKVRAARTSKEQLGAVAQEALKEHPNEWLLSLELAESGTQLHTIDQGSVSALRSSLWNVGQASDPGTSDLIEKGLAIVSVPD